MLLGTAVSTEESRGGKKDTNKQLYNNIVECLIDAGLLRMFFILTATWLLMNSDCLPFCKRENRE